MMQRGGQVVINLLANVKQKTLEPFIKDTIVPGTRVYVVHSLSCWSHKTLESNMSEDPIAIAVYTGSQEGVWKTGSLRHPG